MNKFLLSLKRNIFLYIVVGFVAAFFWNFLIGVIVEPKQEHKIVVYTSASYHDDIKIKAIVDEITLDGIIAVETIKAPIDSYLITLYRTYKTGQIDMVILNNDEAESFLEMFNHHFIELEVTNPYIYNEMNLGAKISEAYNSSEDDYYVFINKNSIHLATNEESVDNYTIDVFNKIVGIE